jgi:hypothetical protein
VGQAGALAAREPLGAATVANTAGVIVHPCPSAVGLGSGVVAGAAGVVAVVANVKKKDLR